MSEQTVNIEGEDVTVKRLNVIIVGKGKTYVEVDPNATWQDILGTKAADGTEIGAQGTTAEHAGQDLRRASGVPSEGDTVTVAPHQVKQG